MILASGYAEMPEGGEKHISVRLEKPFTDQMLARAIERASKSGPLRARDATVL